MNTDTRNKIETVVQAMEQAGNIALYGSTEARSGRVEVTFADERRVAARLLREAHAACRSLANWEAINDAFASEVAREVIHHFELYEIRTIQRTLMRDAMLGAYKCSDPFSKNSKDRFTLCRLAFFLGENTNRVQLQSAQWALDLGYTLSMANSAAVENSSRIEKLLCVVSADWVKKKPSDLELYELRDKLKPVREKIIAHALDDTDISHPTLDQVRRLVQLTLELSIDMAVLFIGSTSDAKSYAKFARKHADKFWRFAFEAPIARYQSDMAQRGVDAID